MRRLLRSRSIHKDERGDTLLEFAVSAVVVFTLLFGIMDFARAMYIYHFVSYAAQAGARYAIVRGSTWSATPCSGTGSTGSNMECQASQGDVQNYVKTLVPPGVSTSSTILGISATWPGTAAGTSSFNSASCSTTTNNPGCQVQVTVTYNFSFMLPFMPTNKTPKFSATSVQVIQQ